MRKYLFFFCFLMGSTSASPLKLGDFLVNGPGIIEILAKKGIKGSDAKQVQSYVVTSITALKNEGPILSRKDVYNVFNKLSVTKLDVDIKKSLQLALDTAEDKMTKEELVSAINHILYLANRYGKSVIITCAQCVNGNLSKEGFKFTIEAIKNTTTLKLLNEVIPKNPVQLNKFITKRMTSLGMGNYSKVTTASVLPEDEKSLALFLGLAESGSADQKALIESIKKVSTVKGKVNIINPKNSHKLWRILADDMTSKDMAGWTKTLEEVSVRALKDDLRVEEAFYRTLKDKAQGNDYLTKQYEALKAKKCFFK